MHQSRRTFLAAGGATLFGGLAAMKGRAVRAAAARTGIAEAFAGKFLLGSAINSEHLDNNDRRYLDLVAQEFNSITPENCQKWEAIQPSDSQWTWSTSDRFVKFGLENNMNIVGHNLVWHQQIPQSVFEGPEGGPASPDLLRARMEKHINKLVGRYKGQIATWDVVNECVSDDGNNQWRDSPWYQILGPGFMEHAFRTARKADPTVELLYNDYNMHLPEKREFLIGIFKDYQARGVPIDGVGFQGHYAIDGPTLQEVEASLEAYAALGLPIHFTEVDVDVLPEAFEYMGAEISTEFEYSDELNPYPDGLPRDLEEALAKRYASLFELFLKHQDNIKRVTFWGTTDAQSWKNDWPVKGRTNYPLLFDREFQPKLAYESILELVK